MQHQDTKIHARIYHHLEVWQDIQNNNLHLLCSFLLFLLLTFTSILHFNIFALFLLLFLLFCVIIAISFAVGLCCFFFFFFM
ncbi:hypothetical protein Hanom_Chr05g00461961 [Helianthus anomalus]